MSSVALKQNTSHMGAFLILLAWFSLIAAMSLNGGFIPEQGQPPLNLFLAGGASLSLFFLAYWRLPVFREYILNLDMRLLIMLHSWRMLGLGFVMLYLLDELPALFAILAGFGDAAAAIGAVVLAYVLFTHQQGVSKRWIWRWNTFGLLDFIVAVSVGILTRTDALLFQANGVSSDLMTVFPFALIPAFLVQVFTLTHIIIYLQLRNNHHQQDTVNL